MCHKALECDLCHQQCKTAEMRSKYYLFPDLHNFSVDLDNEKVNSHVQGGHPQSGLSLLATLQMESVGQDKKTMSNYHEIRHLLLHSLLLRH